MPHPNILRTLGPVRVEMKETWADPWELRPNVIPLNASLAAGGVGQFQFRVPYGYLKHPSESALSNHEYTPVARQWVRILKAPYTAADLIWQGRVESETRELHGPAAGVPSGVQTFTAYCGAQILNKRIVHQTVEVQLPGGGGDGTFETIRDLTPFNLHPHGRGMIKNRSASKRDSGGFEHYVFRSPLAPADEANDNEFWRVRDALEYLLAEWLNGSGDPAIDPQWTLQIPAGQLLEVVDPQRLDPASSVLALMQRILHRHYGWGWVVLPAVSGFLLRIASLAPAAVTYDTITLPANPNVVTVDTNNPDLTISLERSQVENYGRIVVRSAPMVVCRSFFSEGEELLPGWTNSEESAFSSASQEERESGAFQNVYQRFVASWTKSVWLPSQNPVIDEDGEIDEDTLAPLPALHANVLESLPLYRGFDYVAADPPADFEGDGEELLPPTVFMNDGSGFRDVAQVAGASIYTLPTTLGLQARVSDPGIFAGTGGLNWRTAVATLAFQSTQRLQVEYSIPDSISADGVYVIDVPDAEFWFLANGTIYGIKPDGTPAETTEARVVRDDREKLLRVIVGVVARYTQARNRAVVHARGLQSYGADLLKILGSVSDGTDANLIAAPITSVSWKFEGDYETTAATGYAF
jgi:hypothetical protein